MGKQVTGVLVDVQNRRVEVKTLDGGLKDYYRVLNCRCFDIVFACIEGREFSIYCDDEGLLIDSPSISACTKNHGPSLAGNLFITQGNDEGETISLTSFEIELVMRNIKVMIGPRDGKIVASPCLILDD